MLKPFITRLARQSGLAGLKSPGGKRWRGLRGTRRGRKELTVLDLSGPEILMGPKSLESPNLLEGRSPAASPCWLLSLLYLLRPLVSYYLLITK